MSTSSPQDDLKKTVLVVDDDALLVRALSESLESSSYKVLSASSQEEARAVAGKAEWALHGILIDVTLLRVSPAVFAREIREMNPCIRLVFISGFSRDSLEAMGLAVPTYSLFLQKPVHLSALLDIFDAG